MFKLVYKDFVANRFAFMIYYVTPIFFIVYSAFRYPHANIHFMLFVVSFLLPITIVAREDKLNLDPLILSLPFKRKTIVLAKYLFNYSASIFLIVSFFIIEAIILSFLNPTLLANTDYFSFSLIFNYLAFLGLFNAIFYPFVLRFGTMKGLLIYGIILNAFGVILMIILKMSGGTTDIFGSIEQAIFAIIGAIDEFQAILGVPLYAVVLFTFIIALNVLSFRISAMMYQKKEV